MRMQMDWKILIAAIGCLTTVSRGMISTPYRMCTESAKVDSVQFVIWVDTLETTPPPYRSLYTLAFQPGTCMMAKDNFKAYWDGGSTMATFTLRPGTKTVDYVSVADDGSRTTGTLYYAADGMKVDTTESVETVEDSTGKQVVQTTRTRLFAKTGYELATVSVRMGTGPWTLVQQDSAVPQGKGKIVYSKGQENSVTTCVADEKTYTCTPVATDTSGYSLWKEVYYLTGDRVDSLGYFDLDGVHVETDNWFWSSRSNARIVKRAGLSSPRTANPGPAFDANGRALPEWDRAQRRFISVGVLKN
jgi:hypothetical protein